MRLIDLLVIMLLTFMAGFAVGRYTSSDPDCPTIGPEPARER